MNAPFELWGHIIWSEEIIGMSGLYMEPTKDPTMYSLYKLTRLVCFVHCKQQSIKLETDFCYLEDDDGKGKEKFEKLRQEFRQVRGDIDKRFGAEPIEIDLKTGEGIMEN